MNILYTTPNEQFIVTRQANKEWEDIFGVSSTYFNISKRNETLLSGKETLEDFYTIINSTATFESAIRYLRWIKVISTDEMKYQINKYKEENENVNTQS